MATPEDAMCLLFLHEIRSQAEAIGKDLNKKGVRCLAEKSCINAFVNEWTIARLAWIEYVSKSIANPTLAKALKSMILEAVNTYDGAGKIRFVDYQLLLLPLEMNDQHDPPAMGSLFLSAFSYRLDRLPAKSILMPRKKLTKDEELDIMQAAGQLCWVPGFDLNSTLEAFRSKVTPEIVSLG